MASPVHLQPATTQPHDRDHVLSGIVALTQYQTTEQLMQAFGRLLQQQFHAQCVLAFILRQDDQGDPVFELSSSQHQWQDPSCCSPAAQRLLYPLLQKCLYLQRSIYCAEQHCTSVIPIQRGSEVHHVFCLYGSQLSHEDRELLDYLLSVYSNLFTQIDRNDRDSLTGLLNRRVLHNKINQVIKASTRPSDTPFPYLIPERRQTQPSSHEAWLGLFDIDYFKQVNDQYGHIYGDDVLVTLGQLMRRCFRQHDLLFRYGGDEFVVVMSHIAQSDALARFEQFRQQVANHTFIGIGRVSVSIGLAPCEPFSDATDWLAQADTALYEAKRRGRNQLALAPSSPTNPTSNELTLVDTQG